jgi:RND superfamily putative drug exporter
MAGLAAVVFVLVGVLGGPAPGSFDAPAAFDDPGSQATHARQLIVRATGESASPGVIALVRTGPSDPEVARVAGIMRADRGIARVAVPPTGGPSPAVSRDGRQVLVAATLRAGASDTGVVKRLQTALAGHRAVTLGGGAVGGVQIGQQATGDLAIAELLAFPLLALLSLIVFRGVAALLPVAIGGLSVLGTFAVLRAVNSVISLSPFALNLVIGLGLGLAVDYSLFFVSRFREELGGGAAVGDAIRSTMATAGRTVLFSAVTVAAAMACLTVFPQRFLVSMGLGGLVVALVAAASTLLVLPALMVLLGRRLGKVTPGPAGSGRWYRLAQAVMRRPGLVAAATALVLLALAAPSLGLHWSGVDASLLPPGKSARTVSDAVARDFPGSDSTPVFLAVRAPATAAPALETYAAGLRGLPGAGQVSAPRRLGGDTWEIVVDGRGTPITPESQALVRALRAAPAPYPVAVGGATADLLDQQAATARTLPLAVILLVGLTLIVLWLMTGSVVLPIKALLMNLLTTAAAAGVLVLVFQDGRLTGPLGFTRPQGIEQTDFLVLVAIVFGLSTDYGVFLLTRIKEARDGGLPDADAVAVGLERTGAIVTAAAILLAVALGAFVTGRLVFLKELGVGAAVAVLIDAFAIRGLLVPALMALLGRANWWSPPPLRRLHQRLGMAESVPAPPAP